MKPIIHKFAISTCPNLTLKGLMNNEVVKSQKQNPQFFKPLKKQGIPLNNATK